MLNKDVCKTCPQYKPFLDWDAQWSCWKPDSKTMLLVRSDIDPPKWCKRKLEHVVSEEQKC